MTYDELIAYYDGSPPKAAKSLGVSRQLLHHWRENGIPMGRQALIQINTRNRLKADTADAVPRGTAA